MVKRKSNLMDLTKENKEDVDDKRIPRLWYLPKLWGRVSKFQKVIDLQKHTRSSEWVNTTNWEQVKSAKWVKIKKSPHIYLTRGPLTFGHSQLVIQSPQGNNQKEEDFFCLASRIIERVIVVFRNAFCEHKIHKDKTFKELAEITCTEGDYIKTLILRSSAMKPLIKSIKFT